MFAQRRPAVAARGNHGAGGRGARRTNRMYSRSDGTLYTSTPFGNLSLASVVESSGCTCTHTRSLGARFPCRSSANVSYVMQMISKRCA